MDSNRDVAVVTGAASGLGLAIAKKCLERNMNVVMADTNVSLLCDEVEQLSNSVSSDVFAVVTDVSKLTSVRQLAQQTFDQFGKVTWLFNNAGIFSQFAPVWELSPEHIQSVLDVNVFGVLHGIKAFMPHLLKQKSPSRVINMASMYGLCSGSQLAAYALSKSAVISLSESMYFDLQRLKKNVSVSVVCPSFADTKLLQNALPLKEDSLHHMLSELLARSRPASDVAAAIFAGIDQDQFYILPDQEVKQYCAQRSKAIEEQTAPYRHSIERIMQTLADRACRTPSGDCA